jgi:hypothetical protein
MKKEKNAKEKMKKYQMLKEWEKKVKREVL